MLNGDLSSNILQGDKGSQGESGIQVHQLFF